MPSENTPNAQEKLIVTCSPHLHCGLTVSKVMFDVLIALIPATIMAIYSFRENAVSVIIASLVGALLAEYITQKMMSRPFSLSDGSAAVTGLLLALCLPPGLPVWIAFIGGFISIAIGKQVYGGLGQNIFNPAHVGRAILLTSWPVFMTSWLTTGPDAVSTATALGTLKMKAAEKVAVPLSSLVAETLNELHLTFSNLFYGTNMPGSIGETSKLALLLGGLYLLIRGHIKLHGPVAMVATVFIGAYIYGGTFNYALFHLLTGGLMLGAIFMVTDMVTSPVSYKGNIVFGIGCGIITLLIRLKGGYPEGVCYSILIMNAFVPLIDKMFKPRRFGTDRPPIIIEKNKQNENINPVAEKQEIKEEKKDQSNSQNPATEKTEIKVEEIDQNNNKNSATENAKIKERINVETNSADSATEKQETNEVKQQQKKEINSDFGKNKSKNEKKSKDKKSKKKGGKAK